MKNFQVLGNSFNKLKKLMTVYATDHKKIIHEFRS